MGARKRLNSLYFTGILVAATVSGGLTASWTVFVLVAGALTAIFLHSGEIRLNPSRPMRRRHSPRHRR